MRVLPHVLSAVILFAVIWPALAQGPSTRTDTALFVDGRLSADRAFRVVFGGEWPLSLNPEAPTVTIDGSTIRVEQSVHGPPPIVADFEAFAITAEIGPVDAGSYTLELWGRIPGDPAGSPFLIDDHPISVLPASDVVVTGGSPVEGYFVNGPDPVPLSFAVSAHAGICDQLSGPMVAADDRRITFEVGGAPCAPPGLFPRSWDVDAALILGQPGRWSVELRDLSGTLLDSTGFDVLPHPVALRDGRFEVEVQFLDGEVVDSALPVSEPSVDSALFWFFEPTNWELMIKVLDGCAINGHYWVFGAAQTDRAHAITVHDTLTDTTWTTTHLDGAPAPAITDTVAFATCP
ncbi:MAG: hypothetical protein AAGE94_08405 [Acidobacteriota bacterium]